MEDLLEQLNTVITDNKKVQISSLVISKGILLILSPNFFGATSILDNTRHLIGRTSECNFTINDSLVSKRHCIITNEEGKFFIEDIGSRNGTFLNGKPIKKKTALFYGDKITIGETIMRFYLEEKLDRK
jgi:pSer/pThr/pTyr-binding forkhead associated (FHA) protein